MDFVIGWLKEAKGRKGINDSQVSGLDGCCPFADTGNTERKFRF